MCAENVLEIVHGSDALFYALQGTESLAIRL